MTITTTRLYDGVGNEFGRPRTEGNRRVGMLNVTFTAVQAYVAGGFAIDIENTLGFVKAIHVHALALRHSSVLGATGLSVQWDFPTQLLLVHVTGAAGALPNELGALELGSNLELDLEVYEA